MKIFEEYFQDLHYRVIIKITKKQFEKLGQCEIKSVNTDLL